MFRLGVGTVFVVKDGEGVKVDKLDEILVLDVKVVLVEGDGEGLELNKLDEFDIVTLNGLEVVLELLVEGANGVVVDEDDVDGLETPADVVDMTVVVLGIGLGDIELEVEALNVLTAGGK